MKKIRNIAFFWIWMLLIQACTPSAAAVEAAIAKTQAAYTPTPKPSPTPKVLSVGQKYATYMSNTALPKIDAYVDSKSKWTKLMETQAEFQVLGQVGSYSEYINHVFVIAGSGLGAYRFGAINAMYKEDNAEKISKIRTFAEGQSNSAYEVQVSFGGAIVSPEVSVPHQQIVECVQSRQKFFTLLIQVLTTDYYPSGDEISWLESNMACKHFDESLATVREYVKINSN